LGLLLEKLKLGFGLELQSLLFLGQLNLVVVLLGLNDFGKL
jgi:thiol:disulfide interchange protein